MAVPRVGMINPEAPATPVQPRITQPAPGISTATRTTLTSQTRGTQANPPAAKPPATLFPIPTGKPATSVSAPGGMISQAPSGTRPLPSATRGNQTAAAMQARADARAAAVPTTAATPPVAPAPPAAPAPKPQSTSAASGGGKKKKKYTPPAGYDRLAGYAADASPDQILFEKNQIYARNLARGIEMTADQVNQRFDERLARFQQTGEPSKNRDPEDAVAAPVEEVPAETALTPEQQAMQDQIDQLTSLVQELQDSMSSRTEQQNGQEQATTPNPTAPSPLETLAQSLTPKPASGSLANLDQNRIGQMLQVAAPIMFTGTFSDVVAAIIAAGITPTAPELAWLEAEVARYRAG